MRIGWFDAFQNKKKRKSSVIKRHYNVIRSTSGRNNAARSARIALISRRKNKEAINNM